MVRTVTARSEISKRTSPSASAARRRSPLAVRSEVARIEVARARDGEKSRGHQTQQRELKELLDGVGGTGHGAVLRFYSIVQLVQTRPDTGSSANSVERLKRSLLLRRRSMTVVTQKVPKHHPS